VYWTEAGCVFDNGERNIIHDGRIDSCGGPGIELPSGNDDGTYRDIKIKDPVRLASTELSGFLADSAGPVTTTLDNIDVEDTGANMVDGFEFTAGTITNGLVSNCRSRGHSGDQYNVSGDAIFVNNPQGGSHRSIGGGHTITVASGAFDIEPGTVFSSRLIVNGEGASADSLLTINGGENGQVITLFKGDADITVDHGGGNINLAGSADFVINGSFDSITLMRNAGNWGELYRMTT